MLIHKIVYKFTVEKNADHILESIRQNVLNSNIWEMYKNEDYLKEYNYDLSTRKGIRDGGSDMYDMGNIVSIINLLFIYYYLFFRFIVFSLNYVFLTQGIIFRRRQ